MPAPTRNAPTTRISGPAAFGIGGAQRVRPGVRPRELERQRQEQGRRQVAPADARRCSPRTPTAACRSGARLAAEVGRLDRLRTTCHKLARALLARRGSSPSPTSIVAPSPSADLAAQTFRADLFASHGFLIWNDYWYAGHYLPGYSLLFPPLGALLGPRAGRRPRGGRGRGRCSALLARRRHGDRARLGDACGSGPPRPTNLFSGRITFALGIAIGLGALLALQSERTPLGRGACRAHRAARARSPACSSRSRGVAVTLAGDRRGGAAVAVAGARWRSPRCSLAFPTGGDEPFAFTAFIAGAAVRRWRRFVLAPAPRSGRFAGAWPSTRSPRARLFAVAHTRWAATWPASGRWSAGPLLALVLVGPPAGGACARSPCRCSTGSGSRPSATSSDAAGDPSVEHSLLRSRCSPSSSAARRGRPVRIEIPPTRNRWEADYVAPRYPLARGWLRQLESADIDLFTGGNLTAGAPIGAGSTTAAVSYVAVAGREARLPVDGRGGVDPRRPALPAPGLAATRLDALPGRHSPAWSRAPVTCPVRGGRRDRLDRAGPGELLAVDPRPGAVPGPDPLHAATGRSPPATRAWSATASGPGRGRDARDGHGRGPVQPRRPVRRTRQCSA